MPMYVFLCLYVLLVLFLWSFVFLSISLFLFYINLFFSSFLLDSYLFCNEREQERMCVWVGRKVGGSGWSRGRKNHDQNILS